MPSLERVNFSNNKIGSTDGNIDDISDKSDTNYCLSLTDGIKVYTYTVHIVYCIVCCCCCCLLLFIVVVYCCCLFLLVY